MGFSDIIVLATAVHFHYAGFLLPVLTSKIIERRFRFAIRAGAALALAAVPALATGITLKRFNYQGPEFVAAMLFAAAATTIAFSQIHLAWTQFEGGPRALLIVSAVSLIVGMVMVVLFATGGWLGAHLWGIDIPWMLRYHAVINAFGYTLCGLMAWRMIMKSPSTKNG